MKIVNFLIASIILGLSFNSLFSMDLDFESKLLQKALIEGAVTKEQKSAVAHFLSSVASEKRKLAASYRESAIVSHGGKAATQDMQSKRFLDMAKSLENEATSYEALSSLYSPENQVATN
ncbi:MAG: hypothetical protein K8R21_00065 [Leptospira sp.]|nr:hypothetical protein [Leptospira sp.]